VEHIQPKSHPAYAHLAGRWQNLLLACVNCSSTKKAKDVDLATVLLPDRDNTSAAFEYSADGRVTPAPGLSSLLSMMARETLALTGLDKRIQEVLDENGKMVAIDRVSQRMEVWAVAMEARSDVGRQPLSDAIRNGAVRTALGYGFFSVWLAVFANDIDMRNRLIDAFDGTRASGCFHPTNGGLQTPGPTPDGLPYGGKI
jgi:hypothetical protein